MILVNIFGFNAFAFLKSTRANIHQYQFNNPTIFKFINIQIALYILIFAEKTHYESVSVHCARGNIRSPLINPNNSSISPL